MSKSPAPFYTYLRALRFLILWIILPLFSLFILIFTAFYGFCIVKNDYIVTTVEKEIIANTGFVCTIQGKITPNFFPFRFTIEDITFVSQPTQEQNDFTLTINKLALSPDWLALVQGQLALKKLTIQSPVAVIHEQFFAQKEAQILKYSLTTKSTQTEITQPMPTKVAEPAEIKTTKYVQTTAPKNTPNTTIAPTHNKTVVPEESLLSTVPLNIVQDEQTQQFFAVIEEYLHPQKLRLFPNLTVLNASCTIVNSNNTPLITITSPKFTTRTKRKFPKVDLTCQITIPREETILNLKLSTHIGSDFLLSGTASGTLQITPYQSAPLQAAFTLPFFWKTSQTPIDLPGIQITAEADSLQADLSMVLYPFSTYGNVRLENLSLPRWFYFARNLPPGLQQMLHTISGQGFLQLDSQQTFITQLTATAGNVPVTGLVGTKSFTAPVIEADLFLEFGDVDQILPVLATAKNRIAEPDTPVFPHPPLAPYPERPLEAGETATELIDVGYDIHIAAKKGTVHDLASGPFTVRVYPIKNFVTRIAFDSTSIAEGTLKGYLDIDKPLVDMHFEVNNAELAMLPENEGSSVTTTGKLSGTVDIAIDVNPKNGNWADDWRFASSATAKNFALHMANGSWHILSPHITVSHKGIIHAVRKDGIFIQGLWKAKATGFASSWNPQGDEIVNAELDGTISWPAFAIASPAINKQNKDGIQNVSGKLTTSGTCTVRLGDLLTPLSGKTSGDIDWDIDTDQFAFTNILFRGHKSTLESALHIDYANNDILVAADSSFTLNLRSLLTDWQLLPPEGFIVPEKVVGKTVLNVKGSSLTLDPLYVETNGISLQAKVENTTAVTSWKQPSKVTLAPASATPVKQNTQFSFDSSYDNRKNLMNGNALIKDKGGKVILLDNPKLQETPKPTDTSYFASPLRAKKALTQGPKSFWSVTATSGFLNLDGFIKQKTPAEEQQRPSTEPFNISAFEDLNLDAQLHIDNIILQKLTFQKNTLGLKLLDKKYGFVWDAANFYKGTSSIFAYGKLTLPSQISLNKSGMYLKNFSLEPALHDSADTNNYAGKATALFDVHGAIRSNADIPGGLSGSFSMAVTDGAYPAFLGSKTAGLQNTFSKAHLDGTMQNGVLYSDNFTLSGIMVDMKGSGWVDLYRKKLEASAIVTLAKVPSVPVKLSGTFQNPVISIKGTDVVLSTATSATTSVFSLFKAIIELPATTFSAISDLVSPDEKK